jgi:hypothetical protein
MHSPLPPNSNVIFIPAQMSFISFRLSVILPLPNVTTGLSTLLEELVLDFGTGAHAAPEGTMLAKENAHDDEEITKILDNSNRRGGFNHNRVSGHLPLEWPNIDAFQAWHRNKELAHSIELISSTTSHSGQAWTLRCIYVCTHEWLGGESHYEKTTNWERKIPSKKMGCPCNIIIKSYPNTKIVLGCYEDRHDHMIGIANALFMHLTARFQERMREMVIQKIDPREIMHNQVPCDHALLIECISRYPLFSNLPSSMAKTVLSRSMMSAGLLAMCRNKPFICILKM